jgi:hypothetical protein
VRFPLIALLIVLAGATAAAQPASDDDEASRRFDRGAALAKEQKYEEAAREFQASYELRPRKESLFAWAQVARLGGDCSAAVGLYRKFLASPELTPTQVEAAQLGIDRCENAPPAPPPVAPPPPAPGPAAVVTTVPPMVVAAPARSRGQVVAGAALLGGAVAALGASGTFFLLARDDEHEALAADTWGTYHEPASRARARQRWAFGLLGAGLLLGGGAVVEWLATTPRQGETTATAWIAGDGAGLGLQGRF